MSVSSVFSRSAQLRVILILVFVGASLSPGEASKKMTLRQCNLLASELNKSVPMMVDRVTEWATTVCVESGNRLMLRYVYRMDLRDAAIGQREINTLRPRITKSWCSDPGQRKLLELVNIQYYYTASGGGYLGVLVIDPRDCR